MAHKGSVGTEEEHRNRLYVGMFRNRLYVSEQLLRKVARHEELDFVFTKC